MDKALFAISLAMEGLDETTTDFGQDEDEVLRQVLAASMQDR